MDVAEDGWIYCHDPDCGKKRDDLESYGDSLKMGIEVNGKRLPYSKIEYSHGSRSRCWAFDHFLVECETHAWIAVESGMEYKVVFDANGYLDPGNGNVRYPRRPHLQLTLDVDKSFNRKPRIMEKDSQPHTMNWQGARVKKSPGAHPEWNKTTEWRRYRFAYGSGSKDGLDMHVDQPPKFQTITLEIGAARRQMHRRYQYYSGYDRWDSSSDDPWPDDFVDRLKRRQPEPAYMQTVPGSILVAPAPLVYPDAHPRELDQTEWQKEYLDKFDYGTRAGPPPEIRRFIIHHGTRDSFITHNVIRLEKSDDLSPDAEPTVDINSNAATDASTSRHSLPAVAAHKHQVSMQVDAASITTPSSGAKPILLSDLEEHRLEGNTGTNPSLKTLAPTDHDTMVDLPVDGQGAPASMDNPVNQQTRTELSTPPRNEQKIVDVTKLAESASIRDDASESSKSPPTNMPPTEISVQSKEAVPPSLQAQIHTGRDEGDPYRKHVPEDMDIMVDSSALIKTGSATAIETCNADPRTVCSVTAPHKDTATDALNIVTGFNLASPTVIGGTSLGSAIVEGVIIKLGTENDADERETFGTVSRNSRPASSRVAIENDGGNDSRLSETEHSTTSAKYTAGSIKNNQRNGIEFSLGESQRSSLPMKVAANSSSTDETNSDATMRRAFDDSPMSDHLSRSSLTPQQSISALNIDLEAGRVVVKGHHDFEVELAQAKYDMKVADAQMQLAKYELIYVKNKGRIAKEAIARE